MKIFDILNKPVVKYIGVGLGCGGVGFVIGRKTAKPKAEEDPTPVYKPKKRAKKDDIPEPPVKKKPPVVADLRKKTEENRKAQRRQYDKIVKEEGYSETEASEEESDDDDLDKGIDQAFMEEVEKEVVKEEQERFGLVPIQITEGSYRNSNRHFTKCEATWYVEEDVVEWDIGPLNEEENGDTSRAINEEIPNPEDYFGKEFRELFGNEQCEDPDILYMRDERSQCDYMIFRSKSMKSP